MSELNINDKEIEVIKATFADNEELLKLVRALFFGFELTVDEKNIIRDTFSNAELRAIFWRRFHPVLDRNTPIGQVQDVWLGVEGMVFGQPGHVAIQAVGYKEKALEMTKKALNLLDNPDGDRVDVVFVPSKFDEQQISLLARNQFIRHVESQLLFLKTIAGGKTETAQQVKERLSRDSSK